MAGRRTISRRTLLGCAAVAGGALVAGRRGALGQGGAAAVIARSRPTLPYGVQTGDLKGGPR